MLYISEGAINSWTATERRPRVIGTHYSAFYADMIYMILFMPSTLSRGGMLKHNNVNDTALFQVLNYILNVLYITIYGNMCYVKKL